MPVLCQSPHTGTYLTVDCSLCCSIHATAVVQMTHMILRHGGAVPDGPANALYTASAYWSAAVHDFEHGGVNNDFLIKTAHPLAITYNDQSPLENHHLAAATLENLKPQHLYTPVNFAPLCCFTAVSLTLTCKLMDETSCCGSVPMHCLHLPRYRQCLFLAWAACHCFAAI